MVKKSFAILKDQAAYLRRKGNKASNWVREAIDEKVLREMGAQTLGGLGLNPFITNTAEGPMDSIQVFLVEQATDTHSLILVKGGGRDTCGEIPSQQVKPYLRYIRKQRFNKPIEERHITREEFEQKRESVLFENNKNQQKPWD
ncbi:hypothetical protein [Rufibacter sp. XAAS-G3-1]|uniref:hypothetical protein n=1 Tax=Rufibacter sp. XAAS-G3-1 TaxID=2729134 RepID=UPI0015E6963A|nr:hypothetical protein [Rufibacter sp. XAAS-G3-1]